tara:strand:- start:2378 stop:3286 length:909 start_codon:yes stop_codon:yes gene_type:complete
MINKFYLAIILSDYQELNLKRFIDQLNIKNEIIIINGRFERSSFKKNIYKFPKNVKIKNCSNKFVYLIYLISFIIKNFYNNKKFIFGNPGGKLCKFLRIFINGKNQIYVDDGFVSIHFDFNKLKKNCTVFTIYDFRLPIKINKIKFFPKYKINRKKTCDKVLLIGSPFFKNNLLSEYKFMNIMKILSKKNKVIYYYPHRFENIELSLLPKNFEILKRKTTVEKFIDNYKYNFKLIYAFGFSSSIIEISFYNKKENLRALDVNDWIDNEGERFYRKKGFKAHYRYLKKQKINIIKLKKINNLN